MTKEKVVAFPSQESQNEQDQARNALDEYLKDVPQPVREKLAQYDGWISQFSIGIDQALYDLSKDSEEKRDISLPLEALIRIFITTAESLDMQVPQDTLAQHIEHRTQLANEVNQFLKNQILSNPTMPTYQQDVHIALGFVLLSFLYESRLFTFTKQYEEENANGHQNTDSE